MSIPEQFIQNLAEQCEPIPASPSPLRLSGQWLIEAIIYIGVSLLYLGVRPDIKLQLQSPSFYVEFFLLSTLIIMASFSAAALSYPDLYQRRKLIYLPFFTMALLVTFLLIQWQMTTHVTHAPSHTWQCLLSITLLAVLP
ncbi:MAG: DUF1109 family protein, partial [Methylococcales bacterium]|nr:DUF1109 family protein [Methylococcales bacterium]